LKKIKAEVPVEQPKLVHFQSAYIVL